MPTIEEKTSILVVEDEVLSAKDLESHLKRTGLYLWKRDICRQRFELVVDIYANNAN